MIKKWRDLSCLCIVQLLRCKILYFRYLIHSARIKIMIWRVFKIQLNLTIRAWIWKKCAQRNFSPLLSITVKCGNHFQKTIRSPERVASNKWLFVVSTWIIDWNRTETFSSIPINSSRYYKTWNELDFWFWY